MLTRIIQARLEEIFNEVQKRLKASGYDVAAGRRAVLTGGACHSREPANWRRAFWANRFASAGLRLSRDWPPPMPGPTMPPPIGLLTAGATMPPN